MSAQKYTLDKDGYLQKENEETATPYTIALNAFSEGEDTNNLEGECPILFKDSVELREYLNSRHGIECIISHIENEMSVVITNVEVYKGRY